MEPQNTNEIITPGAIDLDIDLADSTKKNDDTTNVIMPKTWSLPYNIECPCCLEIPRQGRIILECRHLLCVACFIAHLKRDNKCPVCRKKFMETPPPAPLPPLPPPAPPAPPAPPINSEAAATIDRARLSSDHYRDHMRRMSNIMTAANLERIRYLRDHQVPPPPLEQYIEIQRRPTPNRPRRLAQNLREAGPLNASRFEYPACNYKFISILIIVDIMVMALWLISIHKTN